MFRILLLLCLLGFAVGNVPSTRDAGEAFEKCDGSMNTFFELLLCPIPEGEKYNRLECREGTCPNCDIDTIKWPAWFQSNRQCNWQKYETVEYPNPKSVSGVSKKLSIVRVDTPPDNTPSLLLEHFKSKIRYYLYHQFENWWQSEQFQLCLSRFKPGEIVTAADFSENLGFLVQNEIQSLHWVTVQCTSVL